jgi:hypothetical protein
MKTKGAKIIFFLIVLLFAIALIFRWQEPVRKEAFNRNPKELIYTKHALCRMDCRQISKKDIDEVMKKGIINYNRSNRREAPCPVYAVQARISSGEYLRVIFAQCDDVTKVDYRI